jgi:hypothetical protein
LYRRNSFDASAVLVSVILIMFILNAIGLRAALAAAAPVLLLLLLC